ncbi:alkylphosphonate utilization protein [Actimicrobium sp. CCC2.4]|uniref:alkylphosphonate utilization protein n=1 Tax=Actimicrobium sp. CCC2.4 TaxID=3048606 RepID=UPI003A1035D7
MQTTRICADSTIGEPAGDGSGVAYNATLHQDKDIFVDVKDSNGNLLADGDSVSLIKDLKVKGTSVTLKRGTVAKNIRLTDDPEEVECNVDKVKGLVLKTCFLKKV